MNSVLQTKRYTVEIDYDVIGDRILIEVWTNEQGHLDRAGDLPAKLEYCAETGEVVFQAWYDGSGSGEHRENDLPAYVVTCPDSGLTTAEIYMIGGKRHREGDKPALVSRYENGQLSLEEYYHFGKRHRDPNIGPAYVKYSKIDGHILEQSFWFNGIRLPDPIQIPTPDP